MIELDQIESGIDIIEQGKKLFVFDMDDTLCRSKCSIDEEMGQLIAGLTQNAQVAIISGGQWEQFEKQVINHLPEGADLSRLSLWPTCGTRLYQFQNGEWVKIYEELLTDEEIKIISEAFPIAVEKAGIQIAANEIYGPQIENRGTQVSWSALGQRCPVEFKSVWDHDKSKKRAIKNNLDPLLETYGLIAHVGGSTTIDVTKVGVDKGYGAFKMIEHLGISHKDTLFVGDNTQPGGNDYPIVETGIDFITTTGPNDTKDIIRRRITQLLSGQDMAQ